MGLLKKSKLRQQMTPEMLREFKTFSIQNPEQKTFELSNGVVAIKVGQVGVRVKSNGYPEIIDNTMENTLG